MNKTSNKFSPEVRDRAVRMVGKHRSDYASDWAALTSVAGKIGCTTETLRRWCREEASRRSAPASGKPGTLQSQTRSISPSNNLTGAQSVLRASPNIVQNTPALFAAELYQRL